MSSFQLVSLFPYVKTLRVGRRVRLVHHLVEQQALKHRELRGVAVQNLVQRTLFFFHYKNFVKMVAVKS